MPVAVHWPAELAGRAFTPVRGDNSGSRLLLVAAEPVAATSPHIITLTASVNVEGEAVTEFSGTMDVRSAPRVVALEGGL